jgi:putative oxidoreductase
MINQRTVPYAALALRLTLGGLFAVHLYSKFFVRDVSNWWNALDRAGYPDWVLAYTLAGEIAGAALLILGVWTRWVSLFTLPLMLGATHFWMVRKSFYFTDAGWEFPAVWAAMLAIQAMLGDGAYALVRSPPLRWPSAASPRAIEP